MKTKLVILLLAATLSASGQDWVPEPPDWLTSPREQNCITITITHNGRSVTRTLDELPESRPDQIVAVNLEVAAALKELDSPCLPSR